jgi:inward rectifier potassium channel
MPGHSKSISLHPSGADYDIRIVGGRSHPLRDFYHALLRLQWPATLAVISAGFMVPNTLFALAYYYVGGVEHARPGSFSDAFFFSVETMATIGYGAMYPSSDPANWLMVVESMVGTILTALATGLVFAKFSRPSARIVFTEHVVICVQDGKPTLMFRLGNERGNAIVDAQFRAILIRTERAPDGGAFYRMVDLKFVRDRALALTRSLSLMHIIDESSPFYGQTPESVIEQEFELQVIVVGTDDIVMQTVHATHNYYAQNMRWGMRLADVLSETSGGNLLLDLHKFHDLTPGVPSADFPYPRPTDLAT